MEIDYKCEIHIEKIRTITLSDMTYILYGTYNKYNTINNVTLN